MPSLQAFASLCNPKWPRLGCFSAAPLLSLKAGRRRAASRHSVTPAFVLYRLSRSAVALTVVLLHSAAPARRAKFVWFLLPLLFPCRPR